MLPGHLTEKKILLSANLEFPLEADVPWGKFLLY